MELSAHNSNTYVLEKPKEVCTPMADTFDAIGNLSTPELIKNLCKNFLKNDEIGFHDGTVSKRHMAKQADLFQHWIILSLGSSTTHEEECTLNMLKKCNVEGDSSILTDIEKNLVSDFLSMPSLESVYIFKENEKTDFWFILSEYKHDLILSCARKFRLFLENNDCCNFDFLALSKEQLLKNEMPNYTCAFHLNR